MIQMTRMGLEQPKKESEWIKLRQKFDRHPFLLLPNFLEPELLRCISKEIRQAKFYDKVHPKGIGSEISMQENTACGILDLILNDSSLFEMIARITGVKSISYFMGRIYRMVPKTAHSLAWHNDHLENRVLGLTINLTPHPYRGGIFQMRDLKAKKNFRVIPQPRFGDALLFKISAKLEHRVTALEGTISRTAFSGWFRSRSSYVPPIKKNLVQRKLKSKVLMG